MKTTKKPVYIIVQFVYEMWDMDCGWSEITCHEEELDELKEYASAYKGKSYKFIPNGDEGTLHFFNKELAKTYAEELSSWGVYEGSELKVIKLGDEMPATPEIPEDYK